MPHFSLSHNLASITLKTEQQVTEVFKGFQKPAGKYCTFFLANEDIAMSVLIMRRGISIGTVFF